MRRFLRTQWAAAAVVSLAGVSLAGAAHADLTVGFITGLSGPGASLGVPYGRGIDAAYAYQSEINGEKIKLIKLDDGSDPSAATRDARKLIEDNKVDVLIGTSTAPGTIAMTAVANELKVPMIAISPIAVSANETGERWVVEVVQPPPVMFKVITDRMAREGDKNVGFIGFSEVWGDLVYAGLKKAEENGAFKVTSNERYSRTDSSVTGQTIKLLAARPDSVMDGGSGAQAALPLLALVDRGFKGKIYGTPALMNADFIRLSGKAAEGIEVSAGPVSVAEQLPDDHYAKKISLAFRDVFAKVNAPATPDGFAAYSFDAWLVFLNAAQRAMAHAKPGTPDFHAALNDALFSTKDLPGTQGIYTFTQKSSYGVDDRALVVVKLINGAWVYQP